MIKKKNQNIYITYKKNKKTYFILKNYKFKHDFLLSKHIRIYYKKNLIYHFFLFIFHNFNFQKNDFFLNFNFIIISPILQKLRFLSKL